LLEIAWEDGMKNEFCRLAKILAPKLLFAGVIMGAASTAGSAQAFSAERPMAMHAVMVNVVNPAANTIWANRHADKLSEQDWRRLNDAVAALTSTVATISRGGPGLDEQKRSRAGYWKEWTGKFSATVLSTKRAVDGRNRAALTAAGDNLVEVCEGCHMAVARAAP
jgi:hypothetical protein